MARRKPQHEARKIAVTIPMSLLQRLDECIPKQQHDEFIVEAIEERLALVEQNVMLEETAGAWTDAHHPDLCTEEDIERWRVELWQGTLGKVYQSKPLRASR